MRLLSILVLFFMSQPCLASDAEIEVAGDYLQVLLPLTALSTSYFLEDENTPKHLSYKTFIRSFSYGLGTTHLIKASVEKRRPNGGNERSFPSGHTYAAFSSAAFINSRFGIKYGLPAFLLAGFVGYSRIRSQNHYSDDVMAGAMVGFLFNEFFTSKEDDIELNLKTSRDEIVFNINAPLESVDKNTKKKAFIKLLLGPAYIQDLTLNDENKTKYNLYNLPREENYNHTSIVQVDYDLNLKNKLSLLLSPYEHFVTGTLGNNLHYRDKTFNASEELEFRWIQYSFDFEYLRLLSKINWPIAWNGATHSHESIPPDCINRSHLIA